MMQIQTQNMMPTEDEVLDAYFVRFAHYKLDRVHACALYFENTIEEETIRDIVQKRLNYGYDYKSTEEAYFDLHGRYYEDDMIEDEDEKESDQENSEDTDSDDSWWW